MNKQLTKNFNIDEFRCKDGTDVPEKFYPNVKLLAKNLQVLRDALNGANVSEEYFIAIHSGYRTPEHNKKVGGAKHSQHLLAKAGDLKVYIKIDGKKSYIHPPKVHSWVSELIKTGKMKQGGLGLYSTFVHYDVRDGKARW